MAVTRILLVRHGDSVHKAEGVYGGPRGCRGLTDTGRAQAEALGPRLAQAGPVTLWCSTIPRAIETAGILAATLGVSGVEQDCGLCSYHLPDWADGLTWDEIRAGHSVPGGGVYHPFERDGEAWADLVVRVSKALTGIAARSVGATAIVVAHAEVVEASLIAFGSLPLYRNFDIKVGPTSITEWTTEDDPSAEWPVETSPWPSVRWTLARLNDTAHLATATPGRP
jgi:probable phosphoglycerate mutase